MIHIYTHLPWHIYSLLPWHIYTHLTWYTSIPFYHDTHLYPFTLTHLYPFNMIHIYTYLPWNTSIPFAFVHIYTILPWLHFFLTRQEMCFKEWGNVHMFSGIFTHPSFNASSLCIERDMVLSTHVGTLTLGLYAECFWCDGWTRPSTIRWGLGDDFDNTMSGQGGDPARKNQALSELLGCPPSTHTSGIPTYWTITWQEPQGRSSGISHVDRRLLPQVVHLSWLWVIEP